MFVSRTSRFFATAVAAGMVLSVSHTAFAKGPGGPGGPGGGPGGGGPSHGGAISSLSVSGLSGSFTLTKADSAVVNTFVTTTKYTATGVTLTVVSSDATPVTTTLTGDLTITTTTTADAAGNGVVSGDLTLKTGTNAGIAAHLEGLVGAVSQPVLVEGELHTASTSTTGTSSGTASTTPPAHSTIAAYLATDANLSATLTGYVATSTVGK